MSLGWPRWQQAMLIAVLALTIVVRLTMLVDTAVAHSGLIGPITTIGGTLINDPGAEAGFGKVVDLAPGGPLAKAGVHEGDQVRFNHSFERYRRSAAGEKLAFTLDHKGMRSNRQLTVEPLQSSELDGQFTSQTFIYTIALIVSLLIGCFILWRGWGNQTVMLLGAALVVMGIGGITLPPWADAPIIAVPMFLVLWVAAGAGCLLLPFAMRMYEEAIAPLARWHWWWALTFVIVTSLVWVVGGWDYLSLTNHISWIGGFSIMAFSPQIGFVATISYLVAGWRKSDTTTRSRFALIILAFAAYMLTVLVEGLVFQAGYASAWMITIAALMMGLIAPGLLAYAVLRHKLFDLGFAVNRTLVYGTVSAVLLVGIGLTEYAVKSLLPKVWTQGSVIISAGLALGLFLIFHRIHHSVEHAIERLFFHKWQVNEAALKRFVAAAGHMEQPEALAGHFTTELARFTGGAAVALYARTAEGQYASAAGETVGPDDLALAAMRAEQGPIVPAEIGSPLDAALALPMMHQAALAGFILLGPKPTGEDYRPDEVEVMAWATHQIGLDLQAIRVRELEQSVVTLEARNANLSQVLVKASLAEA